MVDELQVKLSELDKLVHNLKEDISELQSKHDKLLRAVLSRALAKKSARKHLTLAEIDLLADPENQQAILSLVKEN